MENDFSSMKNYFLTMKNRFFMAVYSPALVVWLVHSRKYMYLLVASMSN